MTDRQRPNRGERQPPEIDIDLVAAQPARIYNYLAGGDANFAVDRDYDDYDDGSWLLAPRAGFFLRPLPNLALWPRAGLTLLKTTADLTGSLSAITLEAPVVLSLPGHIVTCTLTPYAELGYSAGSDGFFGLLPTDHDASELGVALGATVFF